MTRILWIIGLVVAIFVYTGMTALCFLAWITHKHLNLTGFVMLVTNVVAAFLTLGYLRVKLREQRTASSQEEIIHVPKE
jgi:NO-binding membrane sensor protein with MHYT domain